MGVDQTIVRCIRATLEGQLVTTALGVSPEVSQCPRAARGVLSPLLQCLVNELLARINKGVYAQGYAVVSSGGGKIS